MIFIDRFTIEKRQRRTKRNKSLLSSGEKQMYQKNLLKRVRNRVQRM